MSHDIEQEHDGGLVSGTEPELSRSSLVKRAAAVAALAGAGLAGAALKPEDAKASTIATDLTDATGSVNVSAAAAPATGAVLTASSSTAASWVTPVAAQYFEMPSTAPINGNVPTLVNSGLANQNVVNGNQQVFVEYFSDSFNVPAGHSSAIISAEVSGQTIGKGWLGITFDYGQPTGGGIANGLPMRGIYQSAARMGTNVMPLGKLTANTGGVMWEKSWLATGLSSGTNYFSFSYGEISSVAVADFPSGSGLLNIALTYPDIVGVQRTAYITAYNTGKVYPVTLNNFFQPDFKNYFNGGTVGTAITVGNAPVGIAMTNDHTGTWPSLTYANTYVICCNFLGASLSVIDTSNNSIYTTVTLPAGTTPYGIAVAPDNTKAYITDTANNRVYPITSIGPGGTFSVGSAITVGASPAYIAFTQDSKHVYVANNGANTVSVIDASTNTVIRTVTVGASGCKPSGLASTPKPATASNPASATDFTIWVGLAGTNQLVPITDSTGAVGTAVTFNTNVDPASTVISSDGYVAYTSSSVTTTSNMVQTVLQGPGSPAVADYGALGAPSGSAQSGGVAIGTDGTYYTLATGLDQLFVNPGANFYCRQDAFPTGLIPTFEYTKVLIQVI